jgi:hypothetical protein
VDRVFQRKHLDIGTGLRVGTAATAATTRVATAATAATTPTDALGAACSTTARHRHARVGHAAKGTADSDLPRRVWTQAGPAAVDTPQPADVPLVADADTLSKRTMLVARRRRNSRHGDDGAAGGTPHIAVGSTATSQEKAGTRVSVRLNPVRVIFDERVALVEEHHARMVAAQGEALRALDAELAALQAKRATAIAQHEHTLAEHTAEVDKLREAATKAAIGRIPFEAIQKVLKENTALRTARIVTRAEKTTADEREAIETWLRGHNTSPMTNQVIVRTMLPNHNLRSQIASWRE